MHAITRWSKRLGTVVGTLGAFALVAASPAWADYNVQYTYCDFDMVGNAYWHMPKDWNGIDGLYGVWRDVHNNLVNGPVTDYAISGGDNIHAYGEGSPEWALYALVWDSNILEKRHHESCTGSNAGAGLVQSTVQTSVGNPVPPPPALQVDITDSISIVD